MLFIFCITRHARSIINTWAFAEMSMSFLLNTNFLDFQYYIFLVNNKAHQCLSWWLMIENCIVNVKIYLTKLVNFEFMQLNWSQINFIKAKCVSNNFTNITKSCLLVNFNRCRILWDVMKMQWNARWSCSTYRKRFSTTSTQNLVKSYIKNKDFV